MAKKKPKPKKRGPLDSKHAIGQSTAPKIARQKDFLKALQDTFKPRDACEAAGISRHTYFCWLKRDPKFRKMMEIFWQSSIATIEATAFRICAEGVDRTKFGPDGQMFKEKDYPLSLMAFLLKSRKREVYGDRLSVEMSGQQPVRIVLPHNNRDEKKIVEDGAK